MKYMTMKLFKHENLIKTFLAMKTSQTHYRLYSSTFTM